MDNFKLDEELTQNVVKQCFENGKKKPITKENKIGNSKMKYNRNTKMDLNQLQNMDKKDLIQWGIDLLENNEYVFNNLKMVVERYSELSSTHQKFLDGFIDCFNLSPLTNKEG